MIPAKTFLRMLDLLAQSSAVEPSDQSSRSILDLERLQDSCGWPWKASGEQVMEWNSLYARIDPGVREDA